MHELKRRLYKRGSSHEITIPMPLLWDLDLAKKNSVKFKLEKGKWFIELKEARPKKRKGVKK